MERETVREGGREGEGGVIQHYSGLASGAGEGKKDSGVLAGVLGGWVLLVEKMERGQKWPGEPETLSSRHLERRRMFSTSCIIQITHCVNQLAPNWIGRNPSR